MSKTKPKLKSNTQAQINAILERLEMLERDVDVICIRQRHLRKALDKILEKKP